MKNLDSIANELFNKIRGRYPSITVGDGDATITNAPKDARFFEFDFAKGKKVSISLDEKDLTIMYSQKLFDTEDKSIKSNWFAFLKELRQFAKKRMLNFDTRDITKSNLDKRDYQTLSTEKQMSESKLYGTSRTSFQDIGSARMVIKHSQPINQEQSAGRTRDIAGIYIESKDGERFKYPLRHMNGARAMAMHVSEGGNPYDDFGKHIVGLSEELSKLRKFKSYMNRSSVMAESLAGYLDVVNERIEAVKKTAHALQSKAKYQEAFENFETTVLEEVPEDVSNTWIDELTIKQFNEELKGVFPYIYKLVSEANKVKDLGPEDIVDEGKVKGMVMDMEDDAADMSRDDFIKKYGRGYEDIWDKVNDEEYMDPSDLGGPEEDFENHMDSIVNSAEFNQDAPMTEYERAFEDFKMAAANAAAKGEKDFEYPKGSGKKHPVKMDKGTAAKLLADSQTNEDQQLNEFAPLLGLLVPAAGAALRFVAPRVLPGMAKGAKEILKFGARNPIKSTAGAVAAANPQATKDLAVGAVDTVKGIKGAVDGAGEVVAQAKDAIATVGDKVVTGVDDLKAMMPSFEMPGMDKVATIAKQYAIPGAVAAALLLGGYGAYKMLFGDDKERATEGFGDDEVKNILKKHPEDYAKLKASGDVNDVYDTQLYQDLFTYYQEDMPYGTQKARDGDPVQYINDELDELGIFDENDDPKVIDLSPKGKGDEMKQKNDVPIEEFVKSMYDYTRNAFPKGETAVLTSVQKEYGDEAVGQAQQIIAELLTGRDEEMARIQQLAGVR